MLVCYDLSMKGASMFSSGGIAELYFSKAGIDIIVANELIEKRARFYQEMYPATRMVVGDIRDELVKKDFLSHIGEDVKFLIATPPCQGLSTLGKNRSIHAKRLDRRNYLIFDILDVIDIRDFDYILIENVPGLLNMQFPFSDKFLTLEEILLEKYSDRYNVDVQVLNAKDYGVAQSRPRAIIKIYKKGLNWPWPKKEKEITLREAIGHLPSLESGEDSGIKYHVARKHVDNHILWLKHTATGCSAMDNEQYYPQKVDGSKIRGYSATYKRMRWDYPAPAVTMRSDAISSQENVHPGRKLTNGTYSDARVLTLRELFIVFSLPEEWDIPSWVSDTFMRQIIGEGIPPMFAFNIIKTVTV